MQKCEPDLLRPYKNLSMCLSFVSGKPIESSSNPSFARHSYPSCCSLSAPYRSLLSQPLLARNMATTITLDLISRSVQKPGRRETGNTQRLTIGVASMLVRATSLTDSRRYNKLTCLRL